MTDRSIQYATFSIERATDAAPGKVFKAFSDLYKKHEPVYHDIVPSERIICSYDMHHGGKCVSVTLATIIIEKSSEGSILTLTENSVLLAGSTMPEERRQAMEEQVDTIITSLE